MDEIESKRADLVIRIHRLTLQRKLKWSTDNYDNDLQAKIGDTNIVLSSSVNEDGTPYEFVKVERPNNGTEQIFHDGNLSNAKLPTAEFDSFWKLMKKTREMALAQSSRTEETLDEVIKALSDLETGRSKKLAFDTDLSDDVPF